MIVEICDTCPGPVDGSFVQDGGPEDHARALMAPLSPLM
jgi:hypothetical protein